jgi:aminoglycoside phosphotransferase family enzyme/predicted kinase
MAMVGGSLVAALSDRSAYPHPCDDVRLLETHISWVFLTGTYAYKVKKPVDLGFLDFSTLELRHHFCAEELRCNRRFAGSLYDRVVPITAGPEGVVIDGDGEVVDYAVRMHQFPDPAQLDRMLEAGTLTVAELRTFAAELATIHAGLPEARADTTERWGTAAVVRGPVEENFTQIEGTAYQGDYAPRLAALREWTHERHAELTDEFERRVAAGAVRECHGDLHLSNMVQLAGRITAFDCIEFSPALRWIDVLNDVAFLVMDLLARQRMDMAYSVLDAYLDASGDYAGLRLFDYYLVYRSMVRAKVAALGAPPTNELAKARFERHLALAESTAFGARPGLVLTCGLSGSGKSTVAEQLVTALGALRIRSDVERKRLHDLTPLARSGSALDAGLYGDAATEATYRRLAECVGAGLAGGQRVIVDATFLDPARRDTFLALASAARVPAVILYCAAPTPVLEQRVRDREAQAADTSEAGLTVLARQLEYFAAPVGDAVIEVRTDRPLDLPALVRTLETRL